MANSWLTRTFWMVFLILLLGMIGWVAFDLTIVTSKCGIKVAQKESAVEPIPAGFKAAGDEIVTDFRKRRLTKVLVTDRADRPAVRFVLVPQQEGGEPLSFYLSETTVSSDVLAAFDPKSGMTPQRAQECAAWLGGLLPTTLQLKRAQAESAVLTREQVKKGTAPSTVAGFRVVVEPK